MVALASPIQRALHNSDAVDPAKALLDDIDRRQEEILAQLDSLNAKIEEVLKQYGRAPESTQELAAGAATGAAADESEESVEVADAKPSRSRVRVSSVEVSGLVDGADQSQSDQQTEGISDQSEQ